MNKIIGIIAEDNSDIDVIVAILSKYPKNRNLFSFKKFVGNGCGKLKNKCDSWTNALIKSGCQHIFIFHDLDREDKNNLRIKLEKKIPPKKYPNSLIVIPIEELEAWLLSDLEAIKKTFSLQNIQNKIPQCETISSPKEYLGNLIWNNGKKRYLNTIHNKKISENISLEKLKKIPSYKPMHAYIIKNIFPETA